MFAQQTRGGHGVTAGFLGGSPTLDAGFSVATSAGVFSSVVSVVAVILIIGFAVVAIGRTIGRDV